MNENEKEGMGYSSSLSENRAKNHRPGASAKGAFNEEGKKGLQSPRRQSGEGGLK
jgi:hypothetical protein